MNPRDWPPHLQINTLGGWLTEASSLLRSVSSTPMLEARMVASHVLKEPQSWLLAHPEFELNLEILTALNSVIRLVRDGRPFAYISGEREFYGRSMIVRPGLLVPRPETELLVEQAIEWLTGKPDRRMCADVGCGTGCIAVSMAAEIPDLIVDAMDVDPLAVQVTNQNASRHKVESRVTAIQSNLMGSIQRQYDMICANLPYIPTSTVRDLPAARFEPVLALDGGPDGLRLIDLLLKQSLQRLRSGGIILLEIEASQGKSAPALAQQYFPTSSIHMQRDLSGLPRLVIIRN